MDPIQFVLSRRNNLYCFADCGTCFLSLLGWLLQKTKGTRADDGLPLETGRVLSDALGMETVPRATVSVLWI